jgi:hypothetical protein
VVPQLHYIPTVDDCHQCKANDYRRLARKELGIQDLMIRTTLSNASSAIATVTNYSA